MSWKYAAKRKQSSIVIRLGMFSIMTWLTRTVSKTKTFAIKDIAIFDMSHEHLTLEDIFLKLTDGETAFRKEQITTLAQEEEYIPLFSSEENKTSDNEEKEETQE